MENQKTETKKTKVWKFVKNNVYYIALAVLVVMLAVAIVVTSNLASKQEPVAPANANTVSFISPVLNGKITKGYSATELQYNKALNVWEIHKGIDFEAEIGTDVLAVFDGKVTKISTNLLDGTVIEIEHSDGLKTVYASLDSNTLVNVGDNVKKGDVIGKASNTATSETDQNGEVHFEVWKDGNKIDPANYLDLSTNK